MYITLVLGMADSSFDLDYSDLQQRNCTFWSNFLSEGALDFLSANACQR